ncbi:MAG: polysaccharide pyruvyl transferase family protein [Promethearchaeota archaeon]
MLPFPELDGIEEIVIIGNYGSGNVGDEAMLQVLVELISKRFSNVRIIVPSRQPINLGNFIFCKNFYPVNTIKGIYKALFSDVLILGPGTLFSKHAGGGIYVASLVAILRKAIGKKLYLYGIGYSSTTSFLLKILSRIIFKLSDEIYVRDRLSLEKIRHGVQTEHTLSHLSLVPEPALFLKAASSVPQCVKNIKNRKQGPLIGISLSYVPQYADMIADSIAEFVTQLCYRYNVSVCFLTFHPMLVSRKIKSDTELGAAIKEQLPPKIRSNIFVLPYFPPDITLRIIRELDFLVCMRYHSLVFAYKERKPFVAISFEDKQRSFLEEYGGESIDLENLTAKELIQKFNYLYNVGP